MRVYMLWVGNRAARRPLTEWDSPMLRETIGDIEQGDFQFAEQQPAEYIEQVRIILFAREMGWL